MEKSTLEYNNDLVTLAKTNMEDILMKSFNEPTNLWNWKNNNDILTRWVFLKLNILLRNQFNNDLYITQNEKVDWLLASRNYDITIKSKKLKKIILVISINKIYNNINKNFYTIYKDGIFNAANLWTKNIPYYNLFVSPFEIKNDDLQQNEIFSIKNLLRVYNWNKASNITSITKLVLFNWNINKKEKPIVIKDLNNVLNNWQIANALNTGILIPDMKFFFSDIYSILQKYN